MDGLDIKRSEVASRFIRSGCGIEIGAFGRPVRLPQSVNVQYVDKYSALETAQQHGLDHAVTPEPDIRDDGTTLNTIDDESLDFIIACHFLEHCEDLIGTVQSHTRKIKPSGLLFYILPDKQRMFDSRRPSITTWEHLLQDHASPDCSQNEHIDEWCRHVFPNADRHVVNQCPEAIHFHAWSCPEQRVMWTNMCDHLKLRLIHVESLSEWPEVIAVLGRST